jgi:PIN domain nuclease of toxin-antitoxin system
VRVLLDTHLLLWASVRPDLLPDAARILFDDFDNELFFSVVSVWEVAIKRAFGRRDFQVDPSVLRHGLIENGYGELTITSHHAVAVSLLPPIHRDPFDRILVAQATVEAITLLTSDPIVARYPGPVRAV